MSENSISTLLPQLLRLYQNSISSYEAMTGAVTGNEETVNIDVIENDNTITKLPVPTFGYLKNEIQRLERNIATLTNYDSASNSSILLPDGSVRSIILQKLEAEASDLTSINSVTNFSVKQNYFFDDFMTPLLYVSFDLTNQISPNTEEAVLSIFYMTIDSQDKLNYFNSELKGSSILEYDSFKSALDDRGISYLEETEVKAISPRNNRYYGTFDVNDISSSTVTQLINGVNTTVVLKTYRLNKLTYSDSDSPFTDTQSIKIGDSLVINQDPISTRYEVVSVDSGTNSVTLKLLEGNSPITIGSEIFKIYKSPESTVSLDLNVGYGEYLAVFIKPVDPNSRIPAINWSPGSAFFTNDLTITLSSGEVKPLYNYYREFVTDFGAYILGLAVDKIPTSSQAITPDSPVLNSSDFKVVQINQQITNKREVAEIEDLNKQKNTLSSEIKELDNAIAAKRSEIANKNYKNSVERDADKNQLDGLVTQRSTKADLYSSIVKSIDAKATDAGLTAADPKYRVRGFFPLPSPKVSNETGAQQIVQFLIEYKYLNTDGSANPVDTFNFQDGNSEASGAFSNWVEVYGPVRPRVYNASSQKYQWATILTQDSDTININQVDIPITKGEQVEIRVRSVSEAGWPSNPALSDYSESVIISFPTEINTDNTLNDIIKQNQESLAAVKLQEAINSKGIDQHLSSSFTANEKYFAHDATVISSGFVSGNQTPIDLFTKLNQLQNEITSLQQVIAGIGGELAVSIIDDQGVETALVKDQLNTFFAGYYADAVNGLSIKKGAIVTKTYFINIKNTNQNPLELISKIFGSSDRKVRESEDPSASSSSSTILPAIYEYLDNFNTYVSSDSTYNTLYKYDLVPLLLTSPDVTSSDPYTQIESLAPYQSSQVKSQFIYSRYYDVAGEEKFYQSVEPGTTTPIYNLDDAENFYGRLSYETSLGASFIFGGSFAYDVVTGKFLPTTSTTFYNNDDNTIEIHTSHPSLARLNTFKSFYESITQDTGTGSGVGVTIPSESDLFTAGYDLYVANERVDSGTYLGRRTIFPVIRNSKYAPLSASSAYTKSQNMYIFEEVANMGTSQTYNITGSPTLIDTSLHITNASTNTGDGLGGVDFQRGAKMSFESDDQYLLGKKSCGSYLFISTDIHSSICVDGKASTSTKKILNGTNNSIKVPVVFQYRMTDFYGSGTSGLGNIGGDSTGSTTNLTYTKRIGFDILIKDGTVYSYDLEVSAKYKSDSLNLNSVPSVSVSTAVSDLQGVIKNLSPAVPQTIGAASTNTISTG
jgi:prefoldin subunit 5